jgi:hypothetical protein
MADEETTTRVADAIEELTRQAQEGAEGDLANVAVGTQTLMKKAMVRSGDVELPDRVKFYRSRNGWEAWLPTVQLLHHLKKRHSDGTPVFVKVRPGGDPEPIEQTCEVCERTAGFRKKFFHEIDYVAHMENKHQREYRIMQELANKKEVSGSDVAAALMRMTSEEREAVRLLLGGNNATAKATEPAKAQAAKCPNCDWRGKPVSNVAASLRAHQRLHCPARVKAGVGAG